MVSAQVINAQKKTIAAIFARALRAVCDSVAVWLLLATLAAMLPAFCYGIPAGADLTNHFRFALPFYDALHNLRGTPGWLAEANSGWGDPRFRFYPPGLYYLLALARWLCGNWHTAALAVFTLITWLRGVGVYFWAQTLGLKKQASVLAGVAAIFSPYLLIEVYQASLLAEYLAGAVLPFAFAFVARLTQKTRLVDVSGLAASYALLIYSNLPLAVIGSLALLAYTLLRLKGDWRWRRVFTLTFGVMLGLAASASFWVTMWAELPLINSGVIAPNPYYDYRNNFLFSPFALVNTNTWLASLFAVVTLAFIAPSLLLWRGKTKPGRQSLFPVMVLCLGSFLMTTDLSRPLWFLTPKLKEVQFPFRWLVVVSLAGSLLLGASLEAWRANGKNIKPRQLVLVGSFLLSLGFIVHQIFLDCNYLGRDAFEQHIAQARTGPSFPDWLPRQAKEAAQMPKLPEVVETPGRAVNILSWQPEERVFTVAVGAAGMARVKTYYYPHWRAFDGAQELSAKADENGAWLIALPAKEVTVNLRFIEPPRTRQAALVTLAAWLTILALAGGSRFLPPAGSRNAV